MIIAKFDYNEERGTISLKVNGHAGMRKVGEDIVCAAASILTTTLAQTLKMYDAGGLMRSAPRIKLKNGDASLFCRPKTEAMDRVLFDYIFAQTGYVLLAHNYPEFVELAPFDRLDDITSEGT